MAEQGDARTQFLLGVMFENGRGVEPDHKEAAKWYRLAAEQGYEDAQYALIAMYEFGRGVPQDYGEAAGWAQEVARRGHVKAQSHLAFLYLTGRGVPRDADEAFFWSSLAIAQGDQEAFALRAIAAELMERAKLVSEQQRVKASRVRDDEASSSVIGRVQQALLTLGYTPGPVDAIVGDKTREAIRSFEADHGLPVAGQITAELVGLLELEVALQDLQQ
ncbi:MAG: peptidoglycan-binding protein [Alphaproteobacteria bacterium]